MSAYGKLRKTPVIWRVLFRSIEAVIVTTKVLYKLIPELIEEKCDILNSTRRSDDTASPACAVGALEVIIERSFFLVASALRPRPIRPDRLLCAGDPADFAQRAGK